MLAVSSYRCGLKMLQAISSQPFLANVCLFHVGDSTKVKHNTTDEMKIPPATAHVDRLTAIYYVSFTSLTETYSTVLHSVIEVNCSSSVFTLPFLYITASQWPRRVHQNLKCKGFFSCYLMIASQRLLSITHLDINPRLHATPKIKISLDINEFQVIFIVRPPKKKRIKFT